MIDVINEYQKWKQQGEDLRSKAKRAMESRFRELLTEAVHVATEYHTDFGGVLKPPPPVTAFRYKPGKAKAVAVKKAAAPAPEPPKVVDPKVAALQKRLATARKKLDAAKTAGTPTRDIEDKIYEIEDAIRVSQSGD